MTSPDLEKVRLIALPVRTWHDSRTWFEELLREFDVIASDTDDTPGRVRRFIEDVRTRFGQFSEPTNRDLERAFAAGVQALDVDLHIPAAAAPAASELWDRVVEADEFCRQGDLLTMAMDDERRRFIEWYLGEVVRQIEGHPPRPWTDVSDA